MKITALLVLKCNQSDSDPIILANASDVSQFGYFQRTGVKEFIVFFGRTVAKRTPPSQRQSIEHEEYKVHSYNRNGLCAVGFMDDHYPIRSAFSLLNKVLDEYQKNFGDSWRTVQADSTQPWPYLNEALTKFQDPAEADKLLKIQRELDETKIILHKTIDSVLARGEKLDSLVEKSSDLSASSQRLFEAMLRGPPQGDAIASMDSVSNYALWLWHQCPVRLAPQHRLQLPFGGKPGCLVSHFKHVVSIEHVCSTSKQRKPTSAVPYYRHHWDEEDWTGLD
ncbi:Synaptobrevin [Macleaya cordata]|uniref:Synaptobrevin n=1 Tax=Macleaya cordata TaxID=56857 RepID=A0A200QSP2_MACCD|nr:Synaptobrevin [Macleaya cordata]